MDRQARKLQIAREQQGLYEGNATSINPNEATDSHSTATGNAAGATSLGGGSASSATRVSDLSVLSDDDDKEVIIQIQDILPVTGHYEKMRNSITVISSYFTYSLEQGPIAQVGQVLVEDLQQNHDASTVVFCAMLPTRLRKVKCVELVINTINELVMLDQQPHLQDGMELRLV